MSVTHLPQTPRCGPSLVALFPLPLTTMESFMVADATVGYPMMADHYLYFAGRIDRAAFDAGLAFALERNPLLTARVESDGRGGLQWSLGKQSPTVDWAPIGTPVDDRYNGHVDLTKEPGLRIWVREGQDRSTVLLHVHHACADGIGGFAFIEDLMAGYANAYPGATPVPPREVDIDRLTQRGAAGLTPRSLLRKITDSFVGVREAARFFLQSPRPLARAANSDASKSPLRPNLVSQTLSEETTLGLRQEATRTGATVNDVLLRDMFVTLRRWNRERGELPAGANLRILMPQNLREREDRTLPAANVMSFAFVTRRADRCDDPDALLASIHEETTAVRKGKLSLYFLGSLGSLQSAGLLSWLLRRKLCFSTVVLTNLGESTRRFSTSCPRLAEGGLAVGNLVYEGVDAVPPLRPLTRAAFGIRNSPRTLTISLKFDLSLYSVADAEQLLAEYVAQLQATAKYSSKVDASRAACDTKKPVSASHNSL
jgi:hypothetical protein